MARNSFTTCSSGTGYAHKFKTPIRTDGARRLCFCLAGRPGPAGAQALADDGDIELRRGYTLVDLESWPDALGSLDRALQKGGLDQRRRAS